MSAADTSQATDRSSSTLLEIAVHASRAAAAIIGESHGDMQSLQWTEKGSADFVTEVDRKAEAAIASVITGRLPAARVMGEELSPDAASLDGVWFIVDPIDGTTNFMHRYPEYAVSIGVAVDGQIVAGVVQNVPRGDLFTTSVGGGAFCNGRRIHVSSIAQPSTALIGTGFPFKHPGYLAQYLPQLDRVVRGSAGVRRAGSASLDLANVACGRFDAFWELMLAPWDVAAGILLVREAGGVVTDLAGNPSVPRHAPVIAGNPAMHRWLLNTILGTESDATLLGATASS